MSAAVVLGLRDPEGGKVSRSGYNLNDADYVITPGDTIADIAAKFGADISDLTDMKPGDVLPYQEKQMNAGDNVKARTSEFHTELFQEALDMADGGRTMEEAMLKAENMSEDEYLDFEDQAFSQLGSAYSKAMEGVDERSQGLVKSIYAEKYPEAMNRAITKHEDMLSNTLGMAGRAYKPSGIPEGGNRKDYQYNEDIEQYELRK